MNGPPVCLGEKSENAPTWRPRKHIFCPLFCPNFRPIFINLYAPNPYPTPLYPLYIRPISVSIFYYQQTPQHGKGQLSSHSNPNPNHNTIIFKL